MYRYLQTIYNLLRRPNVQPTCLPTYTFRSEPTSTFHLPCVYHTLYTMRKYTHIFIYIQSYTETRSRRESTSKLWGGHRPERSIKLLLLLLVLLLFCLLPFCVYGIRMVGAIATHTQQHQHSNTYTKHTLTRPPHITLLNYSNIRLGRLANAAIPLRCCSAEGVQKSPTANSKHVLM